MPTDKDEDEPERIHGPYKHGDKWRVHIVRGRGRGRGRSRPRIYKAFATRRLAEKWIAGARDEAQGVTVSGALESYLRMKETKGREETTLAATREGLSVILGPYMERPIRSIDGRGEELYAAAQVYPPDHKRAGQPRAADTHRVILTRAKGFGRWCVKQGWFKANPFADVEPGGRRVVGADKPRLTVDRSRKLRAYCHATATVVEADRLVVVDQGAVITLAYLLLGARASELVKRNVGELDDGGRLLWIGKTKTRAGERRLLIPDELSPLLRALAAGRPDDAPLFVSEPSRRWPGGRRWSRFTAYNNVRRVCESAGVPPLGPQALRRTQATLATDAGATGLMVAQHLGHATGAAPVVTTQHYIGRSEARDAQTERALRAITGGAP